MKIVNAVKLLLILVRKKKQGAVSLLFKYGFSKKEIKILFNGHDLYLRPRSTDINCFIHILLSGEYEIELPFIPETILDAGANVGFASIYFAHKYPKAMIAAVEPEKGNYDLLLKNTADYPNIKCFKGALWKTGGLISLVDRGTGSWGFRAVEAGTGELKEIEDSIDAFTVDSLLKQACFYRFELCKIDIEGGEYELFSEPAWVDHVQAVIIEVHDEIVSGCQDRVDLALAGFRTKFKKKENWIYIR